MGIARNPPYLALTLPLLAFWRPNRTFIIGTVAALSTQALRISPTQSFQAFSFSLSTASASAEALAAATAGQNEFPDAVFCCAGAAKPMFIVDMGEAEVEGGMRDGYWVQAWTAWVSWHCLLSLFLPS